MQGVGEIRQALQLALVGFFSDFSAERPFAEAAERLLESILQIYQADGACLVLHSDEGRAPAFAVCLGCGTWSKGEQKYKWRPAPHSLLSMAIRTRGQSIGELALAKVGRSGYFEGEIASELETFVGYLSPILYAERLRAERRILEEQLQQSQKMEAIGTLAGGVAHDFNNLLTVIVGNCAMLTSTLKVGSADFELAQQIGDTAERAGSLIRQLLAFSRKQRVSFRPIGLNKVIEGSAGMLRSLVGEEIELALVLEPSLRVIRADPLQMEQVLLNLASNAKDAMPRGGRLTISTANLAAQIVGPSVGRSGQGKVLLKVADTGEGMTAATKKRIFEPFFTTKEAGKGTGLGLAVVYGIIQQNDGEIEVESTPGLGTALSIYLPATEDVAEELPPKPPARTLQGTETVLLVEDQVTVLALIKRILESNGYQVLAATGGIEAIAISNGYRGPIHMLVTDVVMPNMSGSEVAERLATSRPGIKVLYVSGYAYDKELGDAFLPKPFTPVVLLEKLRQVLQNDGGKSPVTSREQQAG